MELGVDAIYIHAATIELLRKDSNMHLYNIRCLVKRDLHTPLEPIEFEFYRPELLDDRNISSDLLSQVISLYLTEGLAE